MAPSGILFVISAPSGTGKSTVCRRLMQRHAELEFSVSYTTRSRREGEVDGRDYHFVDQQRFDEMVRDKAFLEWARVFGKLYGTGVETTRASLGAGSNLLLDIDVQGARQVRESGIPAVTIMLLPPDYSTLEARLTSRGSESPEQLERRLTQARLEAGDYHLFDYLVVNGDLECTVGDLEAIVRAEFRRTGHSDATARRILDTFPS